MPPPGKLGAMKLFLVANGFSPGMLDVLLHFIDAGTGVADRAVRQYEHLTGKSGQRRQTEDVPQGTQQLGPTQVCLQGFCVTDSRVQVLLIVGYALREEGLVARAEADDVKVAPWRDALQEEDEGLAGALDVPSSHAPAAVHDEDELAGRPSGAELREEVQHDGRVAHPGLWA